MEWLQPRAVPDPFRVAVFVLIKKAADRSAAFSLPGGACAYPAYGITELLFFRTAQSFTWVSGIRIRITVNPTHALLRPRIIISYCKFTYIPFQLILCFQFKQVDYILIILILKWLFFVLKKSKKFEINYFVLIIELFSWNICLFFKNIMLR